MHLDDLPGYALGRQIYESASSLVVQAMLLPEKRSVILKALKPDSLSPEELRRYRQEYEITRLLDAAGIVKVHRLDAHRRAPLLVLEDFGGRSLDRWLRDWGSAGTAGLPLIRFFALAVQMASALAEVHAAGVIHKNIATANIVLNPETGQLKLIDFGLATTLKQEAPTSGSPQVLEGTLPYLSPEQTGRMNRTVDYRTDFYSLGVTFYELLTGRLPFTATDAMEWVHCHLAKTPVPAHTLNPAIPPVVSELVQRMMAKAPEDRYQSARGLEHDLKVCRQHWQDVERIPDFKLGQHDRAERLLIPEKLYGRDTEVERLLAAFERVAAGRSELMLVTGFSGIGKTAIINQIHKPIVRQRGYFLRGKFDQFTRTPLSAFLQAFRDLLGQLSSEGEHRRPYWQEKILSALGKNAQVLIDVIPELQKVIGPQPPPPELSGSAAQNRFHLLLQRFIAAVAAAEHPLVIVLDDLQWADSASLRLLALLMAETQGHLLVLGAYRDNEVTVAHPLRSTLEEIGRSGAVVNKLTLAPLEASDINRLVADMLSCPPTFALPLTRLVFQKTKGNPFFNHQFLKALSAEGVFTFDGTVDHWRCDIDRVGNLRFTDDVTEFVAGQLQRLPGETREVLQLAACIGNEFDLNTLALVHQQAPARTAADLWPAVQQGFVMSQGRVYPFLDEGTRDPELPVLGEHDVQVATYRFLHDRVQQAAYSLIPQGQEKPTHLRIGQLLLAGTPENKREERIFEIVGQFNRGLELLADPSLRSQVARLNLLAGVKAKAATAYKAAADYLAAGRQLLPATGWDEQYDIAFELYASSVEAAYLCGEFTEMEALANTTLTKARSAIDTVRIHEVLLEALPVQNRIQEAVIAGVRVLGSLGVTLPEQPGPADVAAALQATRGAYAQHGIAALVELPLMSDPHHLAVMRLLARMMAPAFLTSPELYALVVMKQVDLSVRYGNVPASAHGYASFGLLLCGAFADVESGSAFGQLALELVHRLNAKEWQCKVTSVVHCFISHWSRPVRDTLAPLRTAYHVGLETGDFQFAGYSAFLTCAFAYFAGIAKDLSELQQETLHLSLGVGQLKQTIIAQYFASLLQALHTLREGPASFQYLQGDAFDEAEAMPGLVQTQDWIGIYYVHFHKLLLHYLFGDHRQAVDSAEQMATFNENARSFPYEPIFCLYDSLSRLAAYRDGSGTEDATELSSRLDDHEAKLRKWLRDAPMNCLHKVALIEAERQRTFGDRAKAIEAYDRAIADARSHGYPREEALANELAGTFYLDWGKERVAQAYLQEAHACYLKWGANAKAAQLERQHGGLVVPTRSADPHRLSIVGAHLDLVTVIKASQAISGEIELGRLLTQMMRIVIENAGAQCGALLLEQGDHWIIEAQATADGDIAVGRSQRLEDASSLSAAIVRQVIRTHTRVLLDDAARTGAFVHDPYVSARQIKSVLCAPLIHHGQLSGVVYLENNLTTHAFTGERWELLNLLSTHMALSLDNARLYQQMQQELAERRSAGVALRKSEERFRTIFDSFSDAVFIHDPVEGTILDVNQTMTKMYGYSREEAGRLDVAALSAGVPPYSQAEAIAWMKKAAEEGPQVFEWQARDRAGQLFWVEVNMRRTPIAGEDRLLVAVRDIHKRKRMEEDAAKLESQLIHAQRMESVGRLAGGVAHDFNNMLSVILGYAELIRTDLAPDERVSSYVQEIEKAGRHSRDITNQLLAFSRKQIIAPRPVVLNELILSLQKTLLQLIGEDIDLQFFPDKELGRAKVDPTQVDQILVNLAVNARDAMPGGGKLTIQTANLSVGEDFCRTHLEFKPGHFVVLTVSDTGVGMDKETAAHIFEPFYTTKEIGKGTGLGLATVYGIIKQNGGIISVSSEPGTGTSFNIYFARYEEEDVHGAERAVLPASVPGAGTVLLVEDNKMVREVTAAMLRTIGYRVLALATPGEALALCEQQSTPIDLLLTDVVMPEMSGPLLRERIETLRPGLRALFMSGYTSNVIVHHGVLQEGVHFIQKPFSKTDLAEKVRQAMAQK